MDSSTESAAVRIIEVGPRDGLQNVKTTLSKSLKVDLILRLLQTGLQNVELAGFVSPRAIPQLADAKQVLSDPKVVKRIADTNLRLPVLVPNLRGYEDAKAAGAKEIAVIVSVSDSFSRANVNCSAAEGLQKAVDVVGKARATGMQVRGYLSCIFSCPFDGPTPHSAVLNCVQRLLAAGCYEVSLGDTLGTGTPVLTNKLLTYLAQSGVSSQNLAVHFHDTYGQALANSWQAYQMGVRSFDSSIAGLGGCPYAPGAKGNLSTEDLVYMFESSGISTGVDLESLVTVGTWISAELNIPNGSRAGLALAGKYGNSQSGSETESESDTGRSSPANSIAEKTSRDEVFTIRFGRNVKVILSQLRSSSPWRWR